MHADTCPDYYVNKMQALMQFFDAIEPIVPVHVVVKKSKAQDLSNDQINLSAIIIEFEREYTSFKVKSSKPRGSICHTGGNSKSDPNAGLETGNSSEKLPDITTADCAGAGILTVIFICSWAGGLAWLVLGG